MPSKSKFSNTGQWWWSSGQHAWLQVWQSEFKSRWILQFSVKFVVEKYENKQKQTMVFPFKKKFSNASPKNVQFIRRMTDLPNGHIWNICTLRLIPSKFVQTKMPKCCSPQKEGVWIQKFCFSKFQSFGRNGICCCCCCCCWG